MAFRLATARTFKAEVKVPVAQENGGYENNTFTAIWDHATTQELDDLRKLTNQELIKKKLRGWEMRDAETNAEVPFTPENLAAALAIPPTPMQLAMAFWEQINGARAKN